MKKQSMLETILLLAVTFLFALVLSGCSTNTPDPEKELAACKAVMEELQSHEGYHIACHRELVGENYSVDFEHWKSGDDWLDLAQPSVDVAITATMKKDGQIFDNIDKMIDSRKDDIKWNPYTYHPEMVEEIPSWLYACHWDDQQVQLLSASRKLRGRVVKVEFLYPYILGNYVTEHYTVEFHFDNRGRFQKAVMSALYQRTEGDQSTQYRWVDEMTILSTDEQQIAAKINGEYQRALEQNGLGNVASGEALATCGAVLKELQSHDSYHLHEETELAGNRFTKDTIRQGEDWFFCNNVEADNRAVGYLSRNGEGFNTQMANERSKPGDLKWASVPGLPEDMAVYAPWIYTCDWDAQDMKLLSDTVNSGERTIRVQIDTPYTYPDGTGPVATGYTVDFHFDKNGDFLDALMLGSFHYEDSMMSEYDFYLKEKVSIVTTDPEEVSAKIDQEYQRALEQNQ